jgi:hypothetical protein
MHPHTGIGGCKVTIVDLDTGVVVPEPDVRDGYLDDRDEPITLTQAAFMKFLNIPERNI